MELVVERTFYVMATIRPPTRSPGFLVLPYIAFGAEHRLAVRFLAGKDIQAYPTISGYANQLAQLVAASMPSPMSLSRYEVWDANNSFVYGASLPASYPGTHGTALGLPAWHSPMIAFTGRGIAGLPGYAVGQTRFEYRVSNAWTFPPGAKRMPFDAILQAIATWLGTNTYFGADFFGQKTTIKAGVTVQFNAHIQRVEGT